MRRLFVSLAGVLVSAWAAASINLNLALPYQTAVRPAAGSIFVSFIGTVDVLLPTFDVSQANLEFPMDASANILTGSFDPAFNTYLGTNAPGVDYTGPIFSIEVTSTTPLGFYWLNGNGLSALSELTVTASNGAQSAADNEFFGVTVVPEPVSLAALGLGLAAVIRRRRSSKL